MSAIILLSAISVTTIAAVAAVISTTVRDGYRRVPTRTF